MTYIYYIDGEKYTTDDHDKVPIYKISSPDEQTPAFEDLETGYKYWCLQGWIFQRLTGPARIYSEIHSDVEEFWLNDKKYTNIHDWLKAHPNQDNAFQIEMLLKYT
jgi:hypothetical protein